jgi:beta-galactosidase/beta-glucuronidase
VWYETEFFVAPDWLDRWVGLRFDSVTHHAQVWINGHPAFSHEGGFLPFGGDVRQWVVAGKANRLTVRVDNTLDWTTLPPGEFGTGKDADGNDRARQIYHFDFFNYSGIYRPVRLVVHGVVHLDKLRLTPCAAATRGASRTGWSSRAASLQRGRLLKSATLMRKANAWQSGKERRAKRPSPPLASGGPAMRISTRPR